MESTFDKWADLMSTWRGLLSAVLIFFGMLILANHKEVLAWMRERFTAKDKLEAERVRLERDEMIAEKARREVEMQRLRDAAEKAVAERTGYLTQQIHELKSDLAMQEKKLDAQHEHIIECEARSAAQGAEIKLLKSEQLHAFERLQGQSQVIAKLKESHENPAG